VDLSLKHLLSQIYPDSSKAFREVYMELEFTTGKTPLNFKVLGGAGKIFDMPTLLPMLEKDKDYANLFLIYNREIKPPSVGICQIVLV
jgi:hypothetical protein